MRGLVDNRGKLFTPKYIVSQTILNKMLEIERSRVIVDQLTLPAGYFSRIKKGI